MQIKTFFILVLQTGIKKARTRKIILSKAIGTTNNKSAPEIDFRGGIAGRTGTYRRLVVVWYFIWLVNVHAECWIPVLVSCRWSGQCSRSTVGGWGSWPLWWCWSYSRCTTPPVSSPTTGSHFGRRTSSCWIEPRETPPSITTGRCTTSLCTAYLAGYKVRIVTAYSDSGIKRKYSRIFNKTLLNLAILYTATCSIKLTRATLNLKYIKY